MNKIETVNTLAELRDSLIIYISEFLFTKVDSSDKEQIYNLATKIAFKVILENLYKLKKNILCQDENNNYSFFFENNPEIIDIINEINLDSAAIQRALRDVDLTEEKNYTSFMYEQSQVKEIRKALGQYFTPDNFIQMIFEKVSFNPSMKVLEPSIGGGSFVNTLVLQMLEEGISKWEIHRFLYNNLYGLDLDPNCIELCHINLSLLADIDLSDQLNLIHDDFLLHDFEDKFDLIIGNPPYNSKLTNDAIQTVTTQFKNIVENDDEGKGTLNSAALFLRKGLDLLKPKGYLAFVIPNSFMRVQEYKKLREYIAKNYNIVHIFNIGKAFKDAGLEMVVIIIQNIAPTKESISILSDLKTQKTFQLPKQYLDSFGIYPLYLDSQLANIAYKIEKDTVKLKDIMTMPRGKGISAKSNFLLNYNNNLIPVLRGKDIGPLKLKNPELGISVSSVEESNLITECILVQNVALRIVATLNEKQVLALDTLNILSFNNEELKKIYSYPYIVGILNSNLVNFYFQNTISNRSKLTIHMDEPYLGNIPIKTTTDISSISKIVLKITELNNQLNSYHPSKLLECEFSNQAELEQKINEFIKQIDYIKKLISINFGLLNDMVYDLYQITDSEKVLIELNQGTNPIREVAFRTRFKSYVQNNISTISNYKISVLNAFLGLDKTRKKQLVTN